MIGVLIIALILGFVIVAELACFKAAARADTRDDYWGDR